MVAYSHDQEPSPVARTPSFHNEPQQSPVRRTPSFHNEPHQSPVTRTPSFHNEPQQSPVTKTPSFHNEPQQTQQIHMDETASRISALNQIPRPQVLEPSATVANISVPKKKTIPSSLPRRRLEHLTQQLGVNPARRKHTITSRETSTPQVSILNTAQGTDIHMTESARPVTKTEIEEQLAHAQVEAPPNVQIEAADIQESGTRLVASETEVRGHEDHHEPLIDITEQADTGQHAPYFRPTINESGPSQVKDSATKKQRKACGFKTRFSEYTKNVLEHAYEFNAEGPPGRKHLEPGIVKKLSDKCGISHEQVKQWIRNRNKKMRRRCQLSESELDLRIDGENMDTDYQFGRMREETLRPSFTLNQ